MRHLGHLAALVSAALCFALAAPAGAQPFPDSIPLPDDFAPEGIATGAGTTFYAGSITLGDIYRGDLRTGEGAIFIDDARGAQRPRAQGRPAARPAVRRRRLHR